VHRLMPSAKYFCGLCGEQLNQKGECLCKFKFDDWLRVYVWVGCGEHDVIFENKPSLIRLQTMQRNAEARETKHASERRSRIAEFNANLEVKGRNRDQFSCACDGCQFGVRSMGRKILLFSGMCQWDLVFDKPGNRCHTVTDGNHCVDPSKKRRGASGGNVIERATKAAFLTKAGTRMSSLKEYFHLDCHEFAKALKNRVVKEEYPDEEGNDVDKMIDWLLQDCAKTVAWYDSQPEEWFVQNGQRAETRLNNQDRQIRAVFSWYLDHSEPSRSFKYFSYGGSPQKWFWMLEGWNAAGRLKTEQKGQVEPTCRQAEPTGIREGDGDVMALVRPGDDVAALSKRLDKLAMGETSLKEVDTSNLWQCVALHRAASVGNVAAMRLLLQEGVDVDRGNDNIDETPLMVVAVSGHLDCLKLLLEGRADVNKSDQQGNTALMKAARWGHVRCVEVLLLNGARVNACTRVALTQAAHYAAREGQTECMKLLLAHGADLDAKNADGETPMDFVKARAATDEAALKQLSDHERKRLTEKHNKFKSCLDELCKLRAEALRRAAWAECDQEPIPAEVHSFPLPSEEDAVGKVDVPDGNPAGNQQDDIAMLTLEPDECDALCGSFVPVSEEEGQEHDQVHIPSPLLCCTATDCGGPADSPNGSVRTPLSPNPPPVSHTWLERLRLGNSPKVNVQSLCRTQSAAVLSIPAPGAPIDIALSRIAPTQPGCSATNEVGLMSLNPGAWISSDPLQAAVLVFARKFGAAVGNETPAAGQPYVAGTQFLQWHDGVTRPSGNALKRLRKLWEKRCSMITGLHNVRHSHWISFCIRNAGASTQADIYSSEQHSEEDTEVALVQLLTEAGWPGVRVHHQRLPQQVNRHDCACHSLLHLLTVLAGGDPSGDLPFTAEDAALLRPRLLIELLIAAAPSSHCRSLTWSSVCPAEPKPSSICDQPQPALPEEVVAAP